MVGTNLLSSPTPEDSLKLEVEALHMECLNPGLQGEAGGSAFKGRRLVYRPRGALGTWQVEVYEVAELLHMTYAYTDIYHIYV